MRKIILIFLVLMSIMMLSSCASFREYPYTHTIDSLRLRYFFDVDETFDASESGYTIHLVFIPNFEYKYDDLDLEVSIITRIYDGYMYIYDIKQETLDFEKQTSFVFTYEVDQSHTALLYHGLRVDDSSGYLRSKDRLDVKNREAIFTSPEDTISFVELPDFDLDENTLLYQQMMMQLQSYPSCMLGCSLQTKTSQLNISQPWYSSKDVDYLTVYRESPYYYGIQTGYNKLVFKQMDGDLWAYQIDPHHFVPNQAWYIDPYRVLTDDVSRIEPQLDHVNPSTDYIVEVSDHEYIVYSTLGFLSERDPHVYVLFDYYKELGFDEDLLKHVITMYQISFGQDQMTSFFRMEFGSHELFYKQVLETNEQILRFSFEELVDFDDDIYVITSPNTFDEANHLSPLNSWIDAVPWHTATDHYFQFELEAGTYYIEIPEKEIDIDIYNAQYQATSALSSFLNGYSFYIDQPGRYYLKMNDVTDSYQFRLSPLTSS